MTVLLGAMEQTPWYPSRFGLLTAVGKRVIRANAPNLTLKKPEKMSPAVLVIVPKEMSPI